jgi:hypothetical protein
MNVQGAGKEAKRYRLRQLVRIVETYGLRLRE